MTEANDNTITLWSTLHDGWIDSIQSDLGARTLAFVVDSPFHREFHQLPSDTRLRVLGEAVRYAETFAFEPWTNAEATPPGMPWEQVEAKRLSNSEKGRMISSDWTVFATEIATGMEYTIISADLITQTPLMSLRFGLLTGGPTDWRDIEIRAERFRFFIGDREYTPEDFVLFGEAYWDAWSARTESARQKVAGE